MQAVNVHMMQMFTCGVIGHALRGRKIPVNRQINV